MALEEFHDDETMAGRGRVPGYLGDAPDPTETALAQEPGAEPVLGETAPVEDPTADGRAVGVAAAPHVSGPGEAVLQPDAHPGEAATYASTSPATAEADAGDVDADGDYDKQDAAVEARMENDVDRGGAEAAGAPAAEAADDDGTIQDEMAQAGEVVTHRSREYRRGRVAVITLLGAAAVATVAACVWYATHDKPAPPATAPPSASSTQQPGDGTKGDGTGNEDNGNEEENKGGPTQIPTLDQLPETYDGVSTWPWGDAANEVGPDMADEHLQDQIASARKHGATVETFSVKDKDGHVVRWGIVSITYPAVDGSTQKATSTEDVVDVLDYYGNLPD